VREYILPAKISGEVVRFSGNGRKLGYPTANIVIQTKLKDGVYFGYADLDVYMHHPAIIFIGTPTTVGDTERRLEAYLLDITDKDYYGLELIVELVDYHRANQTFSSIDELMKVMRQDEINAREWFKKSK
jgi:riboflavin kinase / FMN adenylyltransferase